MNQMTRSRVKKPVRKNFTGTMTALRLDILNAIKQGYSTAFQLKNWLDVSKQYLNYHLKILLDSGAITKYSRGIYDITDVGKKIHATYEKDKNKRFIQLENMRYIAPIYGNVGRILQDMRNRKKSKMNNGVIQYTGNIKNFNVRLFVSKNNNNFEITCQKFVGSNSYELMHDARYQIESTFRGYMTSNELKMGTLQQSMKPEFAIPHKFAKILLDVNNSSQIKMGGTVFNRSQDRNADWEEDDIIRAGNVMRIPDDIQEIRKLVEQPRIVYTTNYPMYL